MKVYLRCRPDREKLFRDILEADFDVETLCDENLSEPSTGELILADLTDEPRAWKENLPALKHSLDEGVLMVVVLLPEQIEHLDHDDFTDDFVAEGSTGGELLMRLRRLTRERGLGPGILRFGELCIDGERYEARVRGRPVELTYKEFELLRFLAERPGKVFTRDILLEQVWGYDYYGGSRTVDVHIRRIRAKIEVKGHTYIRTVRGVVYIF